MPVHHHDNLIYSPGTQVVALREILAQNGRVLHPRGAVGVVVKSPVDLTHDYRVRFLDGVEESLKPREIAQLAQFKEGQLSGGRGLDEHVDLYQHVIYQCIIGSQAYGLADEASDVDRRGIYLPPAERHWSLAGVPEQIECDQTQEAYWEVQKFLVLALKANPNVLECLYCPLVEKATPLAEELLAMRESFLSKLVFQTYNGYVFSQFKKMHADLRNQGRVKWKHVMHLIRLLMSGIHVLREGHVQVHVGDHREQLLAIKRGEVAWEETEKLRKSLHEEFNQAVQTTKLPDQPDYAKVDAYLIRARRSALK
ncbi:DNA polymerase beta superfamily protein [Blastopirellula marina]|uniref:Nucleotidyltransferase n=1 Tax=Blastopirellula marina TaxID=124 RepID=A0A2S8GLJ9_9BACT|nr:nucleotidyltransferase domain-containing protein [Blastopirellula marina]PQO45309.1 nucleotidyltransferase [Blastopirellula marina]